jgi:hypothetical protein
VDVSRRTILLLGTAVLFVGGLGLASCGGGGDATSTSETEATQTTTTETEVDKATVVRVDVVNGSPKGGIVRETVDKGNRVVLVVSSDTADEIHVHGYDISRDVAAGGIARIAFRATVPGRFEVELENRGVQIADLTVQP